MTVSLKNYVVDGKLLKPLEIGTKGVIFTRESRDYILDNQENIISILEDGKKTILDGSTILPNNSDFLIPGEIGLINIEKQYKKDSNFKKLETEAGNYIYFFSFFEDIWKRMKINVDLFNKINNNKSEIENILSKNKKTGDLQILISNI